MSAAVETVRDEHHRCTYYYHVGRPATCKKCGTTGLIWMQVEYDSQYQVATWHLMYDAEDGNRYTHDLRCGEAKAKRDARERVARTPAAVVKVGDRVVLNGHSGTVQRCWRPSNDVFSSATRVRFARGELAVKIAWDDKGAHRMSDWQRASVVQVVEGGK